MKNIIIITAMAVISIAVSAQKLSEEKVPAVVKSAFKAKFPAAVNAQWELEKKDVYEVNFVDNKLKQSAQFDNLGKWEKTETEIKVSELPKLVADAFAKAYPGYKITEAERATTPNYKELFELEIAKGTQKAEIQIMPDGTLIK